MNITEFRDRYLQVQTTLANNLQTLVNIETQLGSLVELITENYRQLHQLVVEYLEDNNQQDME
jgi:hypothetical protein